MQLITEYKKASAIMDRSKETRKDSSLKSSEGVWSCQPLVMSVWESNTGHNIYRV